jgi:hypothetical protein
MIEKICDGRELDIVIIVLCLALLITSMGKGAGKLAIQAFKRFFGREEVNINIEKEPEKANPKKECSGLIDPKKCLAHQAENERSMRHETDITKLGGEFSLFKTQFFAKLENIEGGIGELKISVAQIIVKTDYIKAGGKI